MTDAIPADLAKALASAKPAIPPGAAPAPKPTDKPAAKPVEVKGPEGAKPGDPPPPPGAKTFLGWVAGSVSKKQLLVAAAAVTSLLGGIYAVRLLFPPDDFKPDASATRPLVAEQKPEAKPEVPPSRPTLTIEQPKPADFIPATTLPAPPILSPNSGAGSGSAAGRPLPPPPSFEIPVVGPAPGAAAEPASPVAPTRDKPTPPAPDPLTIPVIPASGSAPVAPPTTPPGGETKLPAIPSVGGGPAASSPMAPALPALPSMLPSSPAAPASPGPMTTGSGPKPAIPEPGDLTGTSTPKPPAAVPGKPVSEPPAPASLVPSVGMGPTVPPAPIDLKPTPAAPMTVKPEPASPGAGGAKIEFVKPADSGTVTPAAGSSRAPTTSYDVDIYHPKGNDTWEAISREYYNDTKFAAALRAYNNGKALTGTVDVPPIHVLRRMTPAAAPGFEAGTPTGRAPAGGDPWNAVGAGPGGGKVYRVPPGSGVALTTVAKQLLGSDQRWREIWDLNPHLTSTIAPPGTELKLPADARVQ